VGIKHVLALPSHSQTNGKAERYQQTLKGEINQVPYKMPSELRWTIESFMEYYNHQRYHEAFENVTPADIYFDRKDSILVSRKKSKRTTGN
jgi:putative transposase